MQWSSKLDTWATVFAPFSPANPMLQSILISHSTKECAYLETFILIRSKH